MQTALTRRLGVPGIVLMVVAAAAPITVVAANFPLILTVSESVGMPLMVLAATAILLLFSVGYAWMTPHVPDAGAFYSYVDRGFGRRAGLGTAGLALFAYVLLTVSMTCYLGVQAGNLIELWTGVLVPWWAISAAMIAVVGFLGYRDINLSAKVLGAVLVLEVAAVLAIDLGVLFSGRELTALPFSPAEAMSGAPGLGLLFAFLGFFGFEATAVFRNEAKDPERTIPRATSIAVLSIGALYILPSWLIISGLGAGNAVALATDSPDSVVVGFAGEILAPIMTDIVQVLVVTSMFACMLAFHNIVSRYLFTLGQRGVLPAGLAAVHPAHGAPSRASFWVTGVTAAVVLVSAVAQLDPVLEIYTWYSGAGAIGVIVMMTLTSFAIVGFGTRGGGVSAPGMVRAAAVAGGIGLLGVLALSLWNFPFLVGGNLAAIIWGAALVIVFAVAAALPASTRPAPADAQEPADASRR